MEATWSTMEKKEKIMWIKKAAEDQKRYEVSVNSLKCPGGLHIICSQHRRELTVDLTLLNREICVRCAHLLLPLPQGRRWSLRVNPRNHHRKFVSSSSSVLPVVCVCGISVLIFFFSTLLTLFRNGYQKFSQEMLSNGELNHLPMKERMTEIGSRWQRLPLKEKDRYKKIAEEKQRQYKVQLEQWLAVRNGRCLF